MKYKLLFREKQTKAKQQQQRPSGLEAPALQSTTERVRSFLVKDIGKQLNLKLKKKRKEKKMTANQRSWKALASTHDA